jgi:hypothetical protein
MTHPMMLVSFSVPPDVTPEFTRFYHHEFLPQILHNSPELANIRRYEEFGVAGTLRWYNKQYLTFYQFVDDAAVKSADELFQRAKVESVVKRFREWKEKSLFNFDRRIFMPTWRHKRQTGQDFDGPFFLWQTEMKPKLDEEFVEWYEKTYLPLQVADLPTWSSVRRYSNTTADQTRRLTLFECANEPALLRSLEDLRSAHRIQENYDWQKRVEAAVTWQDVTSFRPIYRAPD